MGTPVTLNSIVSSCSCLGAGTAVYRALSPHALAWEREPRAWCRALFADRDGERRHWNILLRALKRRNDFTEIGTAVEEHLHPAILGRFYAVTRRNRRLTFSKALRRLDPMSRHAPLCEFLSKRQGALKPEQAVVGVLSARVGMSDDRN